MGKEVHKILQTEAALWRKDQSDLDLNPNSVYYYCGPVVSFLTFLSLIYKIGTTDRSYW